MTSELGKLTDKDLKIRLDELMLDRVKLQAKIHAGTDPKASQLAREVRRNIARVKTFLRERETTKT